MRVYHGSLEKVVNPSLDKMNPRTDFGSGFYTTTNYDQAVRWTLVKQRRSNNFNSKRYVNVFEYNENNSLNVLKFEDANDKWIDFICKNRKSDELIHDYDVVIGPVANDNLYTVLAGYENGLYDKEETVKRLKTYLLSDQISFHNYEALKYLKYVETIEVGEE